MTTDRGTDWAGRKVLVLGCTGFLGSHVVRGLLGRGAEVVGLVRDPNRPSLFFADKLYHQAHVVRGRADDALRLRTLVSVYEIDAVFQCAAAVGGTTEDFTRAALSAAGSRLVVVPVPAGNEVRPRETSSETNALVARLPALFGPGDMKWDRGPARLLLAAARGEPLPPLAGDVLPVRDAVAAILDAEDAVGVRVLDVSPAGTAAELAAATRTCPPAGPRLHATDGAGFHSAVAEAVAWYAAAGPAAALSKAA